MTMDRDEAKAILDRAVDGDPVSTLQISRALRTLGDLTSTWKTKPSPPAKVSDRIHTTEAA
jgi:hypothetical protein